MPAEANFQKLADAYVALRPEDLAFGAAALHGCAMGKGMRGQPVSLQGMRSRRVQGPGKCQGPDIALIKQLREWEEGHKETCECQACVVPAGTVVGVIARAGLDNGPEWLKERKSTWLRRHWESHSQKRLIFCTPHCLMCITEAMFQGITAHHHAGVPQEASHD